jgi:ABC-type multidrug transport system ATPase subunit
MRQKLIISSAFVHKPDVIVVDEPMVGLDPKAARILKDLFREYVRRGHTIMMSTHTLEVAETMCDRIGIIQNGKIRALGTMADLRAASTHGDSGLEDIFPPSHRRERRPRVRGRARCLRKTSHPASCICSRPKWQTIRARATKQEQGSGGRAVALGAGRNNVLGFHFHRCSSGSSATSRAFRKSVRCSLANCSAFYC